MLFRSARLHLLAPSVFRSLSLRSAPALFFALSALGLSCSDNGSTDSGSGGSGGSGAGASGGSNSNGGSNNSGGGAGAASGGAANDLVGSFEITLTPADASLGFPDSTAMVGRVFDRKPTRTDLFLKLDREEGACQLLVPTSPFCDPDCGADAVCTGDNQCTQQAHPQDAGEVSVRGLMPKDFTMKALAPAFAYQPSAGIDLPYPPCAEDTQVQVEAKGFTISGWCITPLELGGADPIVVSSGQALHLTWKPPANPAHSQVSIHIDLAHHGGKKGEINCEVPDTGSFDIPEPLMTRLVGLGLAGFPTVEVARFSRATAASAPGVQLVMSAPVSRALDTGVMSCSEIVPCPDGKTCQADRTCK